MSWFSELVGPRLREIVGSEREAGSEEIVCSVCATAHPRAAFLEALGVCGACGHHFPLSAPDRLRMLFDDEAFHCIQLPGPSPDALKLRDARRYADRLKEAQAKTGSDDALVVAHGKVGGAQAVVAVLDPAFLGGSVGVVVGDGLMTAIRLARLQRAPLIVVSGRGGFRLQEGALALAQLGRVTTAAQELRAERLLTLGIAPTPATSGEIAPLACLADITVFEGPGHQAAAVGDRRQGEDGPETAVPEAAPTSAPATPVGTITVHRRDLRALIVRLVGLVHRRRPPAAVLELRAKERDAGEAARPASAERAEGRRDVAEH